MSETLYRCVLSRNVQLKNPSTERSAEKRTVGAWIEMCVR